MRVWWEGPSETAESFSGLNRRLCAALEKLNVEVSREALPGCDFHVRHRYPPDFSPSPYPLIWMQGCEVGSFPRKWLDALNRVRAYWTYSAFCAKQAVAAGAPPGKVEVIPLGLDPDLFNPEIPPFPLPTRKSFRFLFIGGILYRKGVDLLVRAFTEEFRAHEDVSLVLKGSYYFDRDLLKQIARAMMQPGNPEILFLEEELSPQDLASLYTACHAYVQPYRAEGFGLTLLEAMASGLPVILPRAGSALDFARPEISIQVPARAFFYPDGFQESWDMADHPFFFETDLGLLRQAMRMVYEQADDLRKLGEMASQKILQKWTIRQSAGWILKKLEGHGQEREGVETTKPPTPCPTSQFVLAHNQQFERQKLEFFRWLASFGRESLRACEGVAS